MTLRPRTVFVPALLIGALATCDGATGPGPFSPAESLLTVSAPTVASGSSVDVTLDLRDAAGRSVARGGHAVTISLGTGTSQGTFAAIVDHQDGTYTTSFTGTTAGAPTPLVATVDGVAITSTAAITTVHGPASPSASVVEADRTTVAVCDGTFVTLRVRDAAGNPVTTPVTVVFTQSGNAGGLGVAEYTGNGVYRTSFIASTPGASTIGATINGVPVTSPGPTIGVTPTPGTGS